MTKKTFSDIMLNMKRAVDETELPRHYLGDMFIDLSTVLDYGVTKFIWCLRDCGTFLYPLETECEYYNTGYSNNAYGMKLHKKDGRFFIIGVTEYKEISYEEMLKMTQN